MLHPLRELASEHLGQHPQASTWRERHARYFLTLLDRLVERLYTETTNRPDTYLPHYPNVRAGLLWAVEQRDPDLAYRYLGAVGGLWLALNLYGPEEPLAARVLALPPPEDELVLLRALEVSARCLGDTGQWAAQETRLHEVLQRYDQLGLTDQAEWVRLDLAHLYHGCGQSARALQMQQAFLQAYAARGGDAAADRRARWAHASTLLLSTANLLDLGQIEEALDYAQRAHKEFDKVSNQVFEIYSRGMIGVVLLHLDRLGEAGPLLLACLRDAVDRQLWGAMGSALQGLGMMAARLDDWPSVVQFAVLMGCVPQETSHSQGYLSRVMWQHLEHAHSVMGEADYQDAWDAGTRLGMVEAVERGPSGGAVSSTREA